MKVDRTVALAAVGSVSCVVVVALWAAGDVYAALGDSDPGRPTSLEFGLVRALANAAATVTVGALAFGAFVVPAPPKRARLTAHAYAAVRTAATAATSLRLRTALDTSRDG